MFLCMDILHKVKKRALKTRVGMWRSLHVTIHHLQQCHPVMAPFVSAAGPHRYRAAQLWSARFGNDPVLVPNTWVGAAARTWGETYSSPRLNNKFLFSGNHNSIDRWATQRHRLAFCLPTVQLLLGAQSWKKKTNESGIFESQPSYLHHGTSTRLGRSWDHSRRCNQLMQPPVLP